MADKVEKIFSQSLPYHIKEARETHYWLRLLKDTDYLTVDEANSLLSDVEEILRIIGSIQKTIRNS